MELTVKELRKALEGVPDDAIVMIGSDTGVDQGLGKVVVEGAYMVKDGFMIYANYLQDDNSNDQMTDKEREQMEKEIEFIGELEELVRRKRER